MDFIYPKKERTILHKGDIVRILFTTDADYSPGMIASEGHTEAQVPQSMQVSGSIT